MNQRVNRAKSLLQANNVYPKGCSEFISNVLQVPWEDANSLMGASPILAGVNGNYQCQAGDIIGWKNSAGSGHVAIFIGEPGGQIIDVREPGGKPRTLSSYGPQQIFKSSKY